MNGYDRKRFELSHDAAQTVNMTIEVDFDHTDWRVYETFPVPAGQTVTHAFPDFFASHWVRVAADTPCRATAMLTNE